MSNKKFLNNKDHLIQKWCYLPPCPLNKQKKTHQLPSLSQDLPEAVEQGGFCQGWHNSAAHWTLLLTRNGVSESVRMFCDECVFYVSSSDAVCTWAATQKNDLEIYPPERLLNYGAMFRKITENYLVGLVFSFWMLAALLLLHTWPDLIDQRLKHKRKPQRVRKKGILRVTINSATNYNFSKF